MIDMINNNEKAPKSLGLYIHIPFCRSKCLYCDFCSFVNKGEDEREVYVRALLQEIEQRSAAGCFVDTVYFGGGTPSILTSEQIGRVLSAIRTNFAIAKDVEITLECNPMTHTSDGFEYFSRLRELGVNRLSLGIQSAVDGELKLIGRRHRFEDAERTVNEARRAGFDNISVDLMFGIPSQTVESLAYSIDKILSLGAEHVSIYSLQIEDGTPLDRMRDRFDFPSDDTVADMYEMITCSMRDAGYEHYEISNFAKVGKRSRHNSRYWRLEEYIGFGVAAHSDFDGKRSENVTDLGDYLSGEQVKVESEISLAEREAEFVMLGLRTVEGISKSEFMSRFGIDFDEKYGKRLTEQKKAAFIIDTVERFALNERGFEVSNSILVELLDFDY